MDWNSIRGSRAPYIPELASDDDCRRFDKFDEEEPFYPMDDKKNIRKQRKDINFVGYTYKADVETQKNNLVRALNESLQPEIGATTASSSCSDSQKLNDTSNNSSSNYYMSS